MGALIRALACGAVLLPTSAFAGAWTLPQGDIQIIAGSTYSTADHAFDNKSKASLTVDYDKILAQAFVQYGLTDRLTLILDPEYAVARSAPPGSLPAEARDAAFGAGVRFRVTDSIGVLSLEASAKTAGAFNLSVSANSVVSGRQAEGRVLYGNNFSIADNDDAFLDVQAAYRWVSGGRPIEIPIDITTGWHVSPDWMVMLQNFNIVSGSARAPYGYYRSHKVELSAVYRVSDRYSLQVGAFFSPAGQNALEERGLALSLWTNL